MNEIIEEWKPICGYEGLYEVSNLGKVKSLNYNHTKQEKILKFGKRPNGYLFVNLWKDKKRKPCSVHRLVAIAFIPNPNNLETVNHIDENKLNNCVENLEWCSVAYNNTFGTRIARAVSNTDWKALGKKTAERCSKKVYQYDKNGVLIKIWKSVAEAGRNGYEHGHISDCCRGERNFHKGFKWSYEEIKKEQG